MFKFIQSHRVKITVVAAFSVIGGGAFALAGQVKAKKAAEARAAAAATAPQSPVVASANGGAQIVPRTMAQP